MPTPPVIDGKRPSRIDPHTNFGGGMIGVLSGLRQHIDDQLTNSDRSLNAFDFRVIGFGDDRVKPLIVKIYEEWPPPRCKIR